MEEIVVGKIPEKVVDATPSVERGLWNDVNTIVGTVAAIEIKNETDYAYAGEFLKAVKSKQKQIVDYWEPMRVSAKASYDAVLAHKKEMLDPIDKAEKSLKSEMGRYTAEIQRIEEEKRRKAEEEQRRLIREEMERKLAEAAALEAQGDAQKAEMAMAEAEVLDQIEPVQVVQKPETPKVQGISTQKTWKIEIVDESAVPISVAGVMIRPVDEGAVLRLVKASKGKIQIPGVKISEDSIVRVRN